MEYAKRVAKNRIARFVIVGAVNTTTNFAILNAVFYIFHQGKLVSSIIATSCAIMASFMLNRNFVFEDRQRPFKKLALFIAVSSGGVLLIQTATYALCLALLQNSFTSEFAVINLSNIIASTVVALWNYNGYRLFVFNGEGLGDEITEKLDTDTADPA